MSDDGTRKRIIKNLGNEALKEAQPIIFGSFAMLASSLSNQAVPRLLGKLLDQKRSSGTTKGPPDSTLSSLALVVLGGGLASFVRTTMLNRAEDGIASSLRSQAFGSLLTSKDIEWFLMEDVREKEDKEEQSRGEKEVVKDETVVARGMTPGAIGTILNEDVSTVAKSITSNFANLIRSSSSCMFGTYHMLQLNPMLFAASFSVVPLIGTAAMILRKFVKRFSTKQRETASLAAAFVEERLIHIGMVKMSNREDDEVDEYRKLQDEYVRLGRVVSVANGMFMGFIFAASSGALFMVFNIGGKAVAAGRMTAGSLTSFATYSFLLGLGTSGIFKAISELMQGLVCAQRVYRLIGGDDDDGQTEAADKTPKRTDIDVSTIESITFDNVSFSYKSNPENQILQNMSFTLCRSKVVAMVGSNGSGKSTAASILAGLYKPQSGRVTLNNDIDYNSLDRVLQKQVVQVVPQSPALFNTSILENVRYSRPDATNEEAFDAMDAANCDFVTKFECEMHHQVGLSGGMLSGGQRQRIGLARALLAKPVVLVLDEPTSALDAEGESAVEDTIKACREGPGSALLLITHRAKSLQLADEIMVVKNGEVVESGTYNSLKAKKNSELCALMPELP